MFSKTDRHGAGSKLPSIIGAGMSVTGNLVGDGVIQVEGAVTGDVHCHEVTVGRSAEVRGQIECEMASIHGTVVGEIRAERVTLSASARVTGDIVHEELSIEAGAYVEGQLLRRDAQQARLNLVVGESG
jgi:cytoskeletal protein CcmA (bactofilin family)